ncbi:MAG: TIGR01777 family oxidoreductase [Pseudomonadota bacterium]|nr:TIGR01777 family oxidoreductase [Pseudomonadota bacterium]
MSKHILITGGTGFIGSKLVPHWVSHGHRITVLSRDPARGKRLLGDEVSFVKDFSEVTDKIDWLVNLAGEGIADKRWSESRKAELRASRVTLTESLVRWAKSSGQHFELVLSGSAVGYYGSVPGSTPSFNESYAPGTGFSANLCIEWEQAADALQEISERVVWLRTGIVLGQHGGMLKRMWLPFSLGLGGVIGSGDQVISWIHRDDYIRALDFITKHSLSGAVNMTAPYPATNREFTRTLGNVLHRPTLFPMPAFAAGMVFGEMSELLLQGQKVLPTALLTSGFTFQYPNLSQALEVIAAEW